MADLPIYVTLALALGFLAVAGVFSWRKNRRESRKESRNEPPKKPANVKITPRNHYSDERLQLNLLAMEAARKMAKSAFYATTCQYCQVEESGSGTEIHTS